MNYTLLIDYLLRERFSISCNKTTLNKIKKDLQKDKDVVGLVVLAEDVNVS